MNENLTEKQFNITVKEVFYIGSLLIALLGQWYSQKATLNEAVLIQRSETALLRLEVQVLKSQIDEIKRKKE